MSTNSNAFSPGHPSENRLNRSQREKALIEENPSQEHQQDTDPKAVTPQPAQATEVQSLQSVVAQQQNGAPPASNSADHQEANAEEAVERDLSKFERRILAATWAGVASAAITGIFIYSQFRVMIDQTNILSTQTISAIADSIESGRRIEKQLYISQRQAAAAEESVKAIQRQMRVSERGQIKFSDTIPTNIKIYQPLRVPIQLKNIGKTNVEQVHMECRALILPIGSEPDFTYPPDRTCYAKKGVMYPDESQIFFDRSFDPNHKIHIITKEEFAVVTNNGTMYDVIYGRISYKDIFGVDHWNRFCGFSPDSPEQPSAHKQCAAYNQTDDN